MRFTTKGPEDIDYDINKVKYTKTVGMDGIEFSQGFVCFASPKSKNQVMLIMKIYDFKLDSLYGDIQEIIRS